MEPRKRKSDASLAEHEPESLPEDLRRELDRIVASFERQVEEEG